MSPKKAAEPRPWRRETAGTYRSADDRFVIESDGSGRWYVRDEHEVDELGLARTIGPYPTLVDAKSAADVQRARDPEASPLADRIRDAASRPERPARTAAHRSPPGASSQGKRAGSSAVPEPSEPPPPVLTWLDELRARDPDTAARARSMVAGLERLGIEGAEGFVRRDVLGGQPAVAERLLVEALRRAAADELTPQGLAREAQRRRIDPGDAEALSAFVIARTIEVVLEVVVDRERLEGQPARLPGWQLIERDGAGRRVRVSSEDVTRA
jgi:hypothetical protein